MQRRQFSSQTTEKCTRYLRISPPSLPALHGEGEALVIPCELVRSSRRTLSIQIKEDGSVLLRVPIGVSDEEALAFAGRHERWLTGHYRRVLENKEKKREYSPREIECHKARLRPLLERRLAYYAALMGVSYGRVTIRNQRTRWGSCSAGGNLNFNWKLILMPPEVLDYVVVHELAHRIEMNHSARFWEQVERILPDYQALRRWLRENGGKL